MSTGRTHSSDSDQRSQYLTRRGLLGAVTAGAAGLVAGCTGDATTSTTTTSSSGKSELSFTSGPSNSLAFGMGNALAAVVQDNSELTVNIKSGTSGQSIALVGRGETDISFGTTLVGTRAKNRTGLFSDVEFSQTLLQLPSFYFMKLGAFVDAASDVEYFGDLAGKSLGPGPSGASYWDVWEVALKKALNIEDLQVENSGVGQLSDILSSGQATAVGGPILSNNVTPGFMQQVLSQNSVRMLSYRDETLEAIGGDSKTPLAELKKDTVKNIDEFTAQGDTAPTVSANYVLWTSDAVPIETIYTLLKTSWENTTALSNTHSAFEVWTAKDWYMRNMTPEVPVHPGAAKFLKELGVWSDEYTVGSV
ncbi:TAXI family TRAP transporter solute-binding subunit [Haloferax prahovense]|uniref:TAXI family TRAP transporter solute-binding subunit n=1 Tax=Haloferax prahovense TaxID=381852 RepID=UPI003C77477B